MSNIKILDTSIRQDAHGRYCLNDLHRAAGGAEKHKPANFLRADGVAAFIAELDRTDAQNRASVSSTKGGPNQGTYAAELVVYRYAAWISPAFEVMPHRPSGTPRCPCSRPGLGGCRAA